MPATALARPPPVLPPPGRVPMQFVGLARQLWRRIAAEHRVVEPAQEALVESLRTLLPRRGFRPRRATTPSAFATEWRALPSLGRLALKLDHDPRRDRMHLIEVRAVPGKMRMDRWGGDADAELAIGVLLIEVFYDPREGLRDKRTALGDCCHHAIARRFERGTDRSDAAVLRDLFAPAAGFGDAVKADQRDFEIAAPGGGRWIGERVRYRNRPYLAVRTFVEAQ